MHNSEYDIWCYECGDIAQANEADFCRGWVCGLELSWVAGWPVQFSALQKLHRWPDWPPALLPARAPTPPGLKFLKIFYSHCQLVDYLEICRNCQNIFDSAKVSISLPMFNIHNLMISIRIPYSVAVQSGEGGWNCGHQNEGVSHAVHSLPTFSCFALPCFLFTWDTDANIFPWHSGLLKILSVHKHVMVQVLCRSPPPPQF